VRTSFLAQLFGIVVLSAWLIRMLVLVWDGCVLFGLVVLGLGFWFVCVSLGAGTRI